VPRLLETLQNDVKRAMKAGDTLVRDTLRLVISELKRREVDLGRDLEPDEELAVVTKAVKRREDSVAQYHSAGRTDLADRERAEIEVVRRYLPAVLGEDETRAVVQETITAVGATSKKDLGQVMKAVMAAHRGTVDGKTVQRLAAELLA
jgi:uncharacterized protein YqeY